MSEEMQLAQIVLHEIEIVREDKPGSLENDYFLVSRVAAALREITASFIKEAYDEGYEEGRSDGYSDGEDTGRGEGYDEGYSDGQKDARKEAAAAPKTLA